MFIGFLVCSSMLANPRSDKFFFIVMWQQRLYYGIGLVGLAFFFTNMFYRVCSGCKPSLAKGQLALWLSYEINEYF